MATTPTLNLQWNNPLLYPGHQNNIIQAHIPFHPFKIRRSFDKLRPKCFIINNIRGSDASIAHLAFNSKSSANSKTEKNPVEFVVQTIIKALKAFQKPAATAVLVGLLLMYDPGSAMAASGGRVGGGSFSSRSSISSSRSYSTPRMGEGSGFSYSVPYYAPSPFSGVYVGPALGFGSSFFPIMLAVAAFVLVSGFLTGGSESSVLTDTEKTTVLKLQVGLLGLGRSLQKDLNRIAELADTSNSEGLHYVLTETILSLLRHPDYCISAYSSGTKLAMSSAYHPESDGQTEVLNRCIETYLRCFALEQPRAWSTWVHWAEYWYNTWFQIAAQMTPFEAVYGRKPPVITRFLPCESKVAAVARELGDRDEVLRQLRYNLERAQQRMAKHANLHRRNVTFEVGDRVFLKLRPHRQQSICSRVFQKLAPKFYGPFVVVQRVGEVAYKLQLPVGSRIHPVFHVSQRKKAVGKNTVTQNLPVGLEQDLTFNYEPLRVIAHRHKKQTGY
ncbi:transposon Ty3-G Gag-Pol polyprotein [Dorcoceras hygrometricum]|nr:transposon Ty3-G Gag-Pol polyprotein [Dorcoceras hygrometricum]